jgi:hypothetical protein
MPSTSRNFILFYSFFGAEFQHGSLMINDDIDEMTLIKPFNVMKSARRSSTASTKG